MTRQQMYKALEKLYCETNWNDRESVKRYNEKAREYRHMVYEEEEKEKEETRK